MSNIESSHWLNLELWEEYWRLTKQLHILRDNVESNDTNPFKKMIENQKSPIMYWNRNKPEISLTFDDGYWPESIKTILETLRWSWIKATFFILWECIKSTPNLWKQAIEQWHQICCHTYSHAYLSEWPTTELFKWHSIPAEKRPKLIKAWDENVKRLLWMEYYNKIKSENPRMPQIMNSATLLETELLMREEEIRQCLWEKYLSEMKINHPFFRFPWGCGDKRSENINVLKKHWYLAIWWNGEPKYSIPSKVWNGDIPLFHFDKVNVSALTSYISKMKKDGKNPKLLSEIVVP